MRALADEVVPTRPFGRIALFVPNSTTPEGARVAPWIAFLATILWGRVDLVPRFTAGDDAVHMMAGIDFGIRYSNYLSVGEVSFRADSLIVSLSRGGSSEPRPSHNWGQLDTVCLVRDTTGWRVACLRWITHWDGDYRVEVEMLRRQGYILPGLAGLPNRGTDSTGKPFVDP